MSSHSTFSHSFFSERRFVSELEALVGYSAPDSSAEKSLTTASQGSIQATGDSDLGDTPIDLGSDEEDLPNTLSELFNPASRTTGKYV